ncbi:MAG: hypothetical protein J6125_02870 [Clostridia bacterium]|nr:hypothetical protein [Clostridia bacterium]
MKKRLFLWFLIPALLLCGCRATDGLRTEPPAADEEILAAVRDLLPRAEEINRLFFFDGIPAEEGGLVDGAYTEVSRAFLAEWGFVDLASVRARVRAVYSEGATRDLFELAVDFSTEGGVRPAYLRDLTEKRDGRDVFVCLMVSDAGLHETFDTVVYDLLSITILQKSAGTARVSLSAVVTDADGHSQQRTRTLGLCRESDGWKLDTLSVMKYFEAPQ